MKHLVASVFRSAIAATALTCLAAPVVAKPYCDALLTKEGLSEKHARIAPIYSSAETGWIIANNQLRQTFEMDEKAQALMGKIIQGFEARGAKLAILVAPPRPVIAGQGVLRKTMGDAAAGYDSKAAKASFSALLTQLETLGAIVPDLQTMVLSDPEVRRRFYFRRDTHWTTVGAVHAAQAMAAKVAEQHPDWVTPAEQAILGWKGKIEEKGSLSAVVGEVCGERPAVEVARTAIFAAMAGDLLSDDSSALAGDRAPIALVGTSFSDRYKRDHYRVADALAASFGAEVENHSVSGGGMNKAMNSFLSSGALDTGVHELVIWELPYTQNFNSTKRLGQILKALEARPVTN